MCRRRNKTTDDMFFFPSFVFPLLCFAFSLFLFFLVGEEVNEEGKGAWGEIARNTDREGDNTESRFAYRLNSMTKEKSVINTHTHPSTHS